MVSVERLCSGLPKDVDHVRPHKCLCPLGLFARMVTEALVYERRSNVIGVLTGLRGRDAIATLFGRVATECDGGLKGFRKRCQAEIFVKLVRREGRAGKEASAQRI